MPDDPDEGIVRFDPARFALLKAGVDRGYLCSTCGSVANIEDQHWLLLIAEQWIKDREELQELRRLQRLRRKAQEGMTHVLQEALALMNGTRWN